MKITWTEIHETEIDEETLEERGYESIKDAILPDTEKEVKELFETDPEYCKEQIYNTTFNLLNDIIFEHERYNIYRNVTNWNELVEQVSTILYKNFVKRLDTIETK